MTDNAQLDFNGSPSDLAKLVLELIRQLAENRLLSSADVMRMIDRTQLTIRVLS